MNALYALAAQNTVLALVLALFVHGLTRRQRNPPLSHLLWLLVLLKLVAPPVVRFDWSALRLPGSTAPRGQIIVNMPRFDEWKAVTPPRFVDRPAAQTSERAFATGVTEFDFAARVRLFWNRARVVLLWLWLGGAGLCALVAAIRVVRFDRLLRDTLPASERVQQLAMEVARTLGVRRVPRVRYVECVEVPLLWCAGRSPTIALPLRLLHRFDNQSAALILAHELAHLRRRDHWVRAVEMFVATVYWWNPLVWLVRRQIHQAEDLCCDGWVRWAFPDCTRRYAEVVLETAESLNGHPIGAWLLPASPFLRSLSLKRRIEMILESRFAPCLSWRSLIVVALFAILVVPSFIQTTRMEARAGSDDPAQAPPARDADSPTKAEFPYAVRFEQGATRFSNGDTIAITEVRGTTETFAPGNTYRIMGTYTLASHDQATLAAYITAMDAENGTGPSRKIQTTVVNRGNGSFTLFLPMLYRGWPHVSFYPAEGGSGFGGSYFGTGNFVLKRWWGSNETD